MNQERDRFLTEAMGNHWFTTPNSNLAEVYHLNDDFSTWQNFGKLWEFARKQDWFDDFLIDRGFFRLEAKMPNKGGFTLMHLHWVNPDRFANAICEFLKEYPK